jgi:hypothetical protein
MNSYETNPNRSLVNTAPLFSSVWLAFFAVLRRNYMEHRLPGDEKPENRKNQETKSV